MRRLSRAVSTEGDGQKDVPPPPPISAVVGIYFRISKLKQSTFKKLKKGADPSMKSLPLCSAAMAFSSGRPTRSRKHSVGSARTVLYFS
ncbi:hypothetical protein EYF80_050286 [Liparis tanakae]|uniref:Uncharacterized protein n=1 Tax=Liparis tanakae TaxID=230148 RepID=A0A4Z2FEH0_9TELE|nr:hypothetical protein EYF80_050286 [Liparis tanakae]